MSIYGGELSKHAHNTCSGGNDTMKSSSRILQAAASASGSALQAESPSLTASNLSAHTLVTMIKSGLSHSPAS